MRHLYRFDYALRNEAGDVVDSSEGGAPLTFIEGDGRMVPGLERAIAGHEASDAFSVVILPEDAYGEHDPTLVTRLPLDHLDVDRDVIEPGSVLQLGTGVSSRVVKVIERKNNELVVDGNHPLAGITLRFDVIVLEAREATQDELQVAEEYSEQASSGPDAPGNV